jgi:hypothetical protein
VKISERVLFLPLEFSLPNSILPGVVICVTRVLQRILILSHAMTRVERET